MFNASKLNETKLNKWTTKIILAMEHRELFDICCVWYLICNINFWDICLACYSHRSAKFAEFWRTLSSFRTSSPPTSCLLIYLIRFINIPQFDKHMHYRLAEFCAKFYIGSNFFNILNPFPNHSFNSCQRLVLIKWI